MVRCSPRSAVALCALLLATTVFVHYFTLTNANGHGASHAQQRGRSRASYNSSPSWLATVSRTCVAYCLWTAGCARMRRLAAIQWAWSRKRRNKLMHTIHGHPLFGDQPGMNASPGLLPGGGFKIRLPLIECMQTRPRSRISSPFQIRTALIPVDTMQCQFLMCLPCQ